VAAVKRAQIAAMIHRNPSSHAPAHTLCSLIIIIIIINRLCFTVSALDNATSRSPFSPNLLAGPIPPSAQTTLAAF